MTDLNQTPNPSPSTINHQIVPSTEAAAAIPSTPPPVLAPAPTPASTMEGILTGACFFKLVVPLLPLPLLAPIFCCNTALAEEERPQQQHSQQQCQAIVVYRPPKPLLPLAQGPTMACLAPAAPLQVTPEVLGCILSFLLPPATAAVPAPAPTSEEEGVLRAVEGADSSSNSTKKGVAWGRPFQAAKAFAGPKLAAVREAVGAVAGRVWEVLGEVAASTRAMCAQACLWILGGASELARMYADAMAVVGGQWWGPFYM